MRHSITDRSQVDTGDLGRREGQRNLSEEGRRQATALGASFKELTIPVGEVLSSPVFRALDTAQLAFGETNVKAVPELTADDYEHDQARLAANVAWVSRRLGVPSKGGKVDVLVGHIYPLAMILGRSVSQSEFPEGGLAVFAPSSGAPDFLGFVTPAELLSASHSQ